MKKIIAATAAFLPLAFIFPALALAAHTSTVTITAYVDGQPATTAVNSANGMSFSMESWWGASNLGHAHGVYDLGPVGFNAATPYTAVTSQMNDSYNYATREKLAAGRLVTGVVSNTCKDDSPFKLDGYSTGDTLAAAVSAGATSTYPSLDGVSIDQFVIVWNSHCLTAPVNTAAEGGAKNGATISSTTPSKLDWTDVTSNYGAVTYTYESSYASSTNPVYSQSGLTNSEIPSTGSSAALYYWHAKAVDASGVSSPWSSAFKVKFI
jgi:hypothetical protein